MRPASRPRTLAFALAAVGGTVALVLAFVLFPYHSINHDEGVYLQQATLLLDGRLYLRPPVTGAFRPWFFVRSPHGLYPKYAPYPAVLYAVGMALGSARIALFAVGAAVVGLTFLVGSEVVDRRTGLLAAGFVLLSPLFVVDAATFLPYAPVAALNLGFAYAYFRAERTEATRWALVAGGLIGLSFFARPYTAALFAAPFVVHAIWTLRSLLAAPFVAVHDTANPRFARLRVLLPTAVLGSCGVALALAYNWTTTGNPLVFPYQAFAPTDGLGFGPHSLRGYGHDYTPAVAVRSNAVVVWQFASRWVAGGLLGSALAAVGLACALRRGRGHGRDVDVRDTDGRDTDSRLLVLASLYPSVILGNVYFWGNLNLLAPDLDPTQGLIHYLGPYYHFGLLAPTAIFAAIGVRWLVERVRPQIARYDRRVALVVALTVCVVAAVAAGSALTGPLSRDARNTAQYAQGYAPFTNGTAGTGDTTSGGPPADRVVFLPQTDGAWLNHPFQYLRNDPGFDSRTIYAVDGVRSLAVTGAYPNRTYYRYEFRGTWVPTDDVPVHPALRRVHVTRGRPVTERLTVRLPRGTDFASVRVASSSGHAYYDLNATPGNHTITLTVTDSRVRVGDDIDAASSSGSTSIPVNASDDVTTTVYVETAPSVGFSYESRLPVGYRNGTRASLTPYLEACTDPRTCNGGAAYLPNRVPSQYYVNATLRNGSA